MRLLDRYITHSIIRIFLSTVLVFCLLYIVIDITSNLDEFIDRKVAVPILVKYYLSFFPIILVQTSSIACLISTLFTFSHLNNSNEVIVMRSSGLNFWQITKPALFFGIIISIFVLFLTERFVPKAMETTKQIRNQNMILEVDRLIKSMGKIQNLTFYGLKNRLYYIDAFIASKNELEGITIIEYDETQNIKQKITALRGKWTGLAWKFYQCQITEFDPATFGNTAKVKVYEEKLMDISETPEDFLRQRVNVDSMNIRQLNDYISRFSKSGATKAINNLRVDLHQKIAYPIGNFVIVLTGLPFALMIRSRKGLTFTSLGVAVLIGFLYYVANAVSIAFGKGGLLPPILAAWMTPMLFAGIAFLTIENNF
jgi:lipopolysaccharide export system permease protein